MAVRDRPPRHDAKEHEHRLHSLLALRGRKLCHRRYQLPAKEWSRPLQQVAPLYKQTNVVWGWTRQAMARARTKEHQLVWPPLMITTIGPSLKPQGYLVIWISFWDWFKPPQIIAFRHFEDSSFYGTTGTVFGKTFANDVQS